MAAAYGDAISTYLHGNLKSALAKTDALIKAQPKNPYFYELRGDILLKATRPKDAAAAYAKAVSLDPGKSGLLQVSYGQALVAAGDQASLREGGRRCSERGSTATRKTSAATATLRRPTACSARSRGRPRDGGRVFLRRRLQGCEDLRDARAAEDEARLRRAGFGRRTSSTSGEEEVNFRRQGRQEEPKCEASVSPDS